MIEHIPNKDYSVLDELDGLNLPEGEYMIMGSGILDALGIRKAHDVDMVVSDEAYAHLRSSGWADKVSSDGHVGIEYGVFEAYPDWTDDDRVVKKVDELLVGAEWVNGIPYNSLAKLSLYKTRRGQEKDLADLELIQRYLDEKR